MPCAASTTGNQVGEEARGNILVHGLWNKGTGCVLDTRVTDTDARSYAQLSSAQVLKAAERIKKDKYLAPCLARRRGFMPLVYLVDGMAGKEAKSFEWRIQSTCPTSRGPGRRRAPLRLLGCRWSQPHMASPQLCPYHN